MTFTTAGWTPTDLDECCGCAIVTFMRLENFSPTARNESRENEHVPASNIEVEAVKTKSPDNVPRRVGGRIARSLAAFLTLTAADVPDKLSGVFPHGIIEFVGTRSARAQEAARESKPAENISTDIRQKQLITENVNVRDMLGRLKESARNDTHETSIIFVIPSGANEEVAITQEQKGSDSGTVDYDAEQTIEYLQQNATAQFAVIAHTHPSTLLVQLERLANERGRSWGSLSSNPDDWMKAAVPPSHRDLVRALIDAKTAQRSGVPQEKIVSVTMDPHGAWITHAFQSPEHAAALLPDLGPAALYSTSPSHIREDMERFRGLKKTLEDDLIGKAVVKLHDDAFLEKLFFQTGGSLRESDLSYATQALIKLGIKDSEAAKSERVREFMRKKYMGNEEQVARGAIRDAMRIGEPFYPRVGDPFTLDARKMVGLLYADSSDNETLRKLRLAARSEYHLESRFHSLTSSMNNKGIREALPQFDMLHSNPEEQMWAASAIEYATNRRLQDNIISVSRRSIEPEVAKADSFTDAVEGTIEFRFLRDLTAMRLGLRMRYVSHEKFASIGANAEEMRKFLGLSEK